MEQEEKRKKALNEVKNLHKDPKNQEMFEYLRILMNEDTIESMFKRWQKNAGLADKPTEK